MLNGVPNRHTKLQTVVYQGTLGSSVDGARGLSAKTVSLCTEDLPFQGQPQMFFDPRVSSHYLSDLPLLQISEVGTPADYSDSPQDYFLWIRVVPKSVSLPISLANSPHSTSSIYKVKEHLATTSSVNEMCFPSWGKNNQGSFTSISGEGCGDSCSPEFFPSFSTQHPLDLKISIHPSGCTTTASHVMGTQFMHHMNRSWNNGV